MWEKMKFGNDAEESSESDDNSKPLFKIEKDPNAVMNSNAYKNVQPSKYIDNEVKEIAFMQWKKKGNSGNSLKSQQNSDNNSGHSFLKNLQDHDQSMSSGSSGKK